MRIEKALKLIIILWLYTVRVHAQQHFNTWLRGTVNYKYNERISTEAELQHRRQNGYERTLPWEQNLMYSFRVRVHYNISQRFRFTLSPFAIFDNYKIIEAREDGNAKPIKEYRFATAVTVQQPLSKKLGFTHQTGLEYRIFQLPTPDILRLRSKFELRRRFSSNVAVGAYEEILVNVGGLTPAHIFDQNRLSGYITYNLSNQCKLEAGYIYIHRLQLVTHKELDEHDSFLNLTFMF